MQKSELTILGVNAGVKDELSVSTKAREEGILHPVLQVGHARKHRLRCYEMNTALFVRGGSTSQRPGEALGPQQLGEH